LILLDIIDFLVDKGNNNHWVQISDKNFYKSILNLLRAQNDEQIKLKILSLIKKWGILFQSKRNKIPNFSDIYESLQKNGVVFPDNYIVSYQKYIGNILDNESSIKEEFIFDYLESLKEVLMPEKYEKKYSKLLSYLKLLVENIAFANDLMNYNLIEGVNDIIKSIKKGNNSLIKTMESGKINNANLKEITLGVSKDINKTSNRFEKLTNQGQIEPFISYFIENKNFFNVERNKKMKSSLMRSFNLVEKNKREKLINSINPDPDLYNANNLFGVNEPSAIYENQEVEESYNMNNNQFSFCGENSFNQYEFQNNLFPNNSTVKNPYLLNNVNDNNKNIQNPLLNNNNNFNDNVYVNNNNLNIHVDNSNVKMDSRNSSNNNIQFNYNELFPMPINSPNKNPFIGNSSNIIYPNLDHI
jgi:hypothetical protein